MNPTNMTIITMVLLSMGAFLGALKLLELWSHTTKEPFFNGKASGFCDVSDWGKL